MLYGLIPPLLAGLIHPRLGDTMLRRVGITDRSFDLGVSGGLFVFPVLIATFVSMFLFLRLDPTFDHTRLWNRAGLSSELKRVLIVFALLAPLMLLASWLMSRYTDLMPHAGFLRLPREAPWLMVAITLLYPWFSAYPQEITHRAFFFHRYAPIIGAGTGAFVLNVLAFSWLHATMWNWVALVMTLPAGVLFAYTYRRSGSALAAGFEHAIYGIWVFFTGLGYFVYTGSVAVG